MDAFYTPQGIDWRLTEDAEIDIVCHSQGGVVVREMLRGLRADAALFPSGNENAANHIRKIVTVNSPHQGSSVAGSSENAGSPGLKSLLDDADASNIGNLSDRTLFSAHVDVELMEKSYEGAAAGGNAVIGGVGEWIIAETGTPLDIVNVVTIPVTLGLGGVGALFGGGVGAFTDVNLKMKGPYLGPYTVEIEKDAPFGDTFDDTDIDSYEGPEDFRDKLYGMRYASDHLNGRGEFLQNLNPLNGIEAYPLLPNGKKVRLLPMFSEDMRPLLSQLIGQIAGGADRFCAEGSKEAGCFAAGQMIRSYIAESQGYDISDLNFNDDLWQVLEDLQNHWFRTSDIIIDASSQKFVKEGTALNVDNDALKGFLEEPRTYEIHNALAPWEPVAHGPFSFSGSVDHLGELSVDNKGAALQGLDLLCALNDDCKPDGLSGAGKQGLMRTSATSVDGLVPTLLNSAENGYQVSTSSVGVTGDFDLSPMFIASGYQGIGIQEGGEYKVVAAYEPGEGSYIWWTDAAGNEQRKKMLDETIATQPSIARTASGVEVTFKNYSGTEYVQNVDVLLNESVDMVVLAERGAPIAPIAYGTGVATDPATQEPPKSPANVAIENSKMAAFLREIRGSETNTSRPRIAVQNISDEVIHGYKVAYYFTADPARKPVVELDYPHYPVSVENLGGDQWRFVIDATNEVLQPEQIAPNNDGWQIRLHYSDWSDYKHLDDYSADYNIGFIKANAKIVVYDPAGEILWGVEPKPFTTQHTGALPVAEVEMSWEDTAPWELNAFKPQVTIENVGSVALKNYHAKLYFRVPVGKELKAPPADWYTPESTPSVKDLGNGVFELNLLFNQHILYPGQSVTEGNIGLNLVDWANMDKNILGMALFDENGELIFGSPVAPEGLPAPPVASASDLDVLLKDEGFSESNAVKPRFKIKNTGSSVVNGFTLTFNFSTENGKSPALETWYLPQCVWSLENPVGDDYYVEMSCADFELQPGETWPNDGGAVFGLHYEDWSPWDKSNDAFIQGVQGEFKSTPNVLVTKVATP